MDITEENIMLDINVFNYILMLQLKLSTYNNSPLTAEDQSRSVTLTVSEEPLSPWMFAWENSAKARTWDFINTSFLYPERNISAKVLQLPVPADGIIPFHIELTESVSSLTIEVMRAEYDS